MEMNDSVMEYFSNTEHKVNDVLAEFLMDASRPPRGYFSNNAEIEQKRIRAGAKKLKREILGVFRSERLISAKKLAQSLLKIGAVWCLEDGLAAIPYLTCEYRIPYDGEYYNMTIRPVVSVSGRKMYRVSKTYYSNGSGWEC